MSIDPFILHGRGGLQSGLTPLNLPVKEKKPKVHVGWVCMSMTLSVYHWNSSMNQGSTVNVTSNFTPEHLGPEQLFFFSYVCLCWLTSLNILGRWRIVWMIVDGMMVWMLQKSSWISRLKILFSNYAIDVKSLQLELKMYWNPFCRDQYVFPQCINDETHTPPRSTDPLLSNTFFCCSSTFFLGTFLSETSSMPRTTRLEAWSLESSDDGGIFAGEVDSGWFVRCCWRWISL